MSQLIPLQAVPNQTLAVPLAGQRCSLNVYQQIEGLFIDVALDDAPVILGVLCLDRNRIIRNAYLGFAGDFTFFDTQGAADPLYTGLGARFQLVYIEAAEIPGGAG